MRRGVFLRLLLAGAVATVCSSLPATADIKSFNAAMLSRDYKHAAAEAAETWPTLNKSRKDIAVIAREFGFAAYLANDYTAAKAYGETAVSAGAALDEPAELRAGSNVLLRLASFKLAPSDKTRDELHAALTARADYPGVDLITFYGLDAVTTRDFAEADWKRALSSAALGEAVMSGGGDPFLVQTFRFGLFKGVARYMATKNVDAYRDLLAMRTRVIEQINVAASDDDAKGLIDFYWGLEAWQISIGSHLSSRAKLPESDREPPSMEFPADARSVRLLNIQSEHHSCVTQISARSLSYPSEALYKGMIGTVILQADIDAKGAASNPKILAAVPKDGFGDAVLRAVKRIEVTPGKDWGPTCTLAKQGKVLTFVFEIG